MLSKQDIANIKNEYTARLTFICTYCQTIFQLPEDKQKVAKATILSLLSSSQKENPIDMVSTDMDLSEELGYFPTMIASQLVRNFDRFIELSADLYSLSVIENHTFEPATNLPFPLFNEAIIELIETFNLQGAY
jgi:hypothetical protein